MKSLKKIIILATPLLLFVVLLVPYSWANQQFLVEWLGCGCPVIDEFGNIVENNFNANDFTALFWSFISICATATSVFLSRNIPKEKMWLRVVYIVGIFFVSFFIFSALTSCSTRGAFKYLKLLPTLAVATYIFQTVWLGGWV